jgi:hypothetical protein
MISKKVLEKKCLVDEAPAPTKRATKLSTPKQKTVSPLNEIPVREPSPPPVRRVVKEGAANRCKCIIITKTKEKKECGRPIKEFRVCGIHKRKCLLSDGILTYPNQEIEDVEEKNLPEVDVLIEQKEVSIDTELQAPALEQSFVEAPAPIQDVDVDATCPCIIKSKSTGIPNKRCGRKIKQNGRCGIHQNTCNMADVFTCPCIVKKTGLVCGRKVKAHGKCAYHQNTCQLPNKSPSRQDESLVPQDDATISIIDEEIIREVMDEKNLEEGDEEISIEVVPIELSDITLSNVKPKFGDFWTSIPIPDISTLQEYVENVNPNVDLTDVIIEDKILNFLNKDD